MAPITLGVISLKTRMKNVAVAVAIIRMYSPSPKRRMDISATSTAEAAFTRLLPSRITPRSRSVFSRSSWVRRAERRPSRTRCFSRLRLSAIMLVSAIEKNPATSSITARAVKSQASGMWSDTGAGPQPRWRMISRTNLLPRYASSRAMNPPSVQYTARLPRQP